MKTLAEEVQEDLGQIDPEKVTGEDFNSPGLDDAFICKIEADHLKRLVGLRTKLAIEVVDRKRQDFANNLARVADVVTESDGDLSHVFDTVNEATNETAVLENKMDYVHESLWAELKHISPEIRRGGHLKVCRGLRVFRENEEGFAVGLKNSLEELSRMLRNRLKSV